MLVSDDPSTVSPDPGKHAAAWGDDPPTSRLTDMAPSSADSGEALPEPSSGVILRSRFVLRDIIGRGGTSFVFRARDLHRALPQEMDDSAVAIKVLRAERRDDPLTLTLLQREFQQMQRLSHPGIARVFDLDCDGDIWFMSMELVAGQTVKSWLRTSDGAVRALPIIACCAEALEYAHSLGIIHGDLKPTNVMVTGDGRAKLIDFGSAPSPGTVLATGLRPILGITPLYASPQILAGQSAERRDDVYSLACLSYYILSGGEHPFGGHPALENGRAKSAPDLIRTIPAEMFAVIERGLAAERERRPASVREFLHDLTEADRDHREAAAAAIPKAAVPPVRQRSRWFTAPMVSLAAVACAILGLVALLNPGAHPGAEALETATDVAAVTAQPLTTGPSEIAPGAAVSVISFETPVVHASSLQSLVAIPVRRLNTKGRATFVWRTESGTARAGIDYQSGDPQVVRFHDGQAVRTLFVPLISNGVASAHRGPLTFTVALERVAGGAALGQIASVTVAIDPPPASNRSAIYSTDTRKSKEVDCRQRAPLRLACLFSWRARPATGPATLND